LNRSIDVLVSGYYGFGNLGDELLAESAVRLLESAGIERTKIAILSAVPRKTQEDLRVHAFNRWDIREVYRAMKMAKTLLIGGGGLFQDSTSVRSCLYYWGIVRIARLCGTCPWAAGQSIGPFRTAFASCLAKNAFSSCVYRGVRNKSSLGILNNWGLIGNISPDLVMSLKVRRNFQHGNRMLLNLRGGYEKMSRIAVKGAVQFSEKTGLSIIGVAFSEEDVREIEKYHDSGALELEKIVLVKTLSEFEDTLNGASCAIGMRLHFLILALLAGLPLCGIPYDPKVRAFCEEWDIPSVCNDSFILSVPADEDMLNEAGEKVFDSFRQGLSTALGG